MTALIVIAVILLFFVLVALFPLRIRVSFNDSVSVYIPILFFKIPIYPTRKRIKSLSGQKFRELRKAKSKKKPTNNSSKADSESENKTEKLSFKTIKPHLSEITLYVKDLLYKFNRHLNAKIYALYVVVSSDDAAKTAITYGAVSSSVSVLMSILEDRCNIKYSTNAKTGVYVDYTLGKCIIECDIRFTLRVWQIISLAVSAAMSFIKTKTILEVKNNVREQDQ